MKKNKKHRMIPIGETSGVKRRKLVRMKPKMMGVRPVRMRCSCRTGNPSLDGQQVQSMVITWKNRKNQKQDHRTIVQRTVSIVASDRFPPPRVRPNLHKPSLLVLAIVMVGAKMAPRRSHIHRYPKRVTQTDRSISANRRLTIMRHKIALLFRFSVARNRWLRVRRQVPQLHHYHLRLPCSEAKRPRH